MTFEEFFARERRLLEELYKTSGAARWRVPFQAFAETAWKGIAAAAEREPGAVADLLKSLRVEDLALALGCLAGDATAWDVFCARYRPALYEAGRAFTRDETAARELGDSLLGELFGLDASRPVRGSRLSYFHGRSSLRTWLRAVLYQKFVDEFRRESRLAPLEEEAAEPANDSSSVSEQDDRRYAEILSEAVESALGALPAAEKILLGAYYVQQLTLKQIGRLTGEHEATISRRLEALRTKLRKRIEGHLKNVRRLSAFEIDQCLDFAARGVTVKLERILKSE